MANIIQFTQPLSASLTGAILLDGQVTLTQQLVGSSSYSPIALSSSYALTASAATSITFPIVSASHALNSDTANNSISSSFATTASAATSITFPIVSSSYATTTTILNGQASGSFTGSFTGSLLGNATTATSASFATTASAATSITFPIVSASHALNSDTSNSAISASYALTASAATSITFPIVSSSYATNASVLNGQASGSFTGSFTGSLLGNATTATSASFATTSSAATSITFPIVSASHALNSDTANNATSASFATATSILNGQASGSFTGSLTGSLLGNVVSSSYAVTSSAATSITFPIISASHALNSDNANVTISSSYALSSSAATSITFPIISSSYALNATTLNGQASGSHTGSFTGSLLGNASTATSASFATTSSAATSITFPIVSSSYAITSSFATTAATSSISSTSTLAANAVFATSASYAGTASLLLGSITSASYALTASFAANAVGGGPINASQVNPGTYPSGAYIYTGSLTITGSVYSRLNIVTITGSYTASESDQFIVINTGGSTASVYLPTVSGRLGALLSVRKADTSSFPVVIYPSGTETIDKNPNRALISYADGATLVAGSGLWMSDGFNTASIFPSASYAITASFASNATTPVSVSFATTSSAATSITFPIVSSSYALTASFASNGGTGGPTNASQVNPGTYPSGAYIYTGSLTITGSVYSRLNVKVVTGSYTASESDQFIDVNTGGATASIYLPTVSGRLGAILAIRKEDTSSFPVVIYPSGTETIDYNPNRSLINLADGASLVAGFGLWMSDGFSTSSIFPSASYAITSSYLTPITSLLFNPLSSTPSAPSSNTMMMYTRTYGNKILPVVIDNAGFPVTLQPAMFNQNIEILSTNATTTIGTFGNSVTSIGTVSHSYQERYGYTFALRTGPGSGSTVNSASVSSTNATFLRGSATSGSGGFFFFSRVGLPDGAYTSSVAQSSGCRIFTGLTDQTVNGITVNDSSSLGNAVGFQFSAPRGDATWQIVARNGSNPITIQDTGLPFIVNEMYDFYLYCPISGTAIGWRIDSVLGQLSFSGSISGTLPTATTAMRFGTSMNGNGVSHQIIFQELYCESHR